MQHTHTVATNETKVTQETRESRRAVTVSEEVWTEVKVLAARRGQTISELVEEILGKYVTATIVAIA